MIIVGVLGQDMSELIDAQLVDARMRDLGQSIVNQTVSLFKGGIFALAAVLLLEIALQPQDRLVHLVLWGASFLLAMVSYNAHINTSVIVFRESVAAVVVIIVQMMIELMLFVVLTPRPQGSPWRFWIVVYGAFQFVTAARLLIFPMNRGLKADGSLQPLLDQVEAGRRSNGRRMFLFALLTSAIAAPILSLPEQSTWPALLATGYGIVASLYSVFGLTQMHRQRAMMEQMIERSLTEK
jgi:hypothetical protein